MNFLARSSAQQTQQTIMATPAAPTLPKDLTRLQTIEQVGVIKKTLIKNRSPGKLLTLVLVRTRP